ncbi:MAG: hypothetical protein HW389_3669 [Bacteroidetes bacterium]|nr:hypothetical protein [Bacteroidota bacterium]
MSETAIKKTMIIGEAIHKYPATEKVFLKHFGSGCFTCPNSKMEDIAFGSTMHGLDPDMIVKELNEAVGTNKTSDKISNSYSRREAL